MKKLHTFLFFTLVTFACYAQTNKDKARLAYSSAKVSYENNNYQASIDSLQSAIELLGSTNIRIQTLMVKSYVGLKNYTKAKVEMKNYFDLSPQKDAGYDDMLKLSATINVRIFESEKKLAWKNAEKAAWDSAFSTNTIESYQKYLVRFPTGTNATLAKSKIDDQSWDDALDKNTVVSYQSYLNSFPEGTHITSANARIKEIGNNIKYNDYKKQADDAYNLKDWETAKTYYEFALGAKPNDSYASEKLKIAVNESKKIELTKNIAICKKNKSKLYTSGTLKILGGIVLVGGGIAALASGGVAGVVVGLGAGCLGAAIFVKGCEDISWANDVRKNLIEYQQKLNALTP